MMERVVDESSRWAHEATAFVAERSLGSPMDRSLRVTVNFHPDRVINGVSVTEQLGKDGVYRCQFETGTSNGALNAQIGGARWRWEQRMFGNAYDDAPSSERPKYGAVNHRHRSIGGAPRFGSSHLRLAEHVLDRTTFCFPDSVFEPRDFGAVGHFDLLRLADAFERRPLTDVVEAEEGGVLDDYIEAHVHGELRVTRDVEAVVLDPSFHDTDTEEQAGLLGVPVEWHEGRRLTVSELDRHPWYRGPRIVEVGKRISALGMLDARIVGLAVNAGKEDPQELKKVWHHVARFGKALT